MPFFCTCGMGFDAFISMKFAEAGKRGVITYVQKVLEEGLNTNPKHTILKIMKELTITKHSLYR